MASPLSIPLRGAAITLLVWATAGLAGCGSDSSAQPGPASNPSSPQAPAESLAWDSVILTVQFCDFAICHGTQGFTVGADGHFSIAAGGPPDGSVTADELASFSAAATAVAAEAPLPEPVCTNLGHLLGASSYTLQMKFSDGSIAMVKSQSLDSDGLHACLSGDSDLAGRLVDEATSLAEFYDPGTPH